MVEIRFNDLEKIRLTQTGTWLSDGQEIEHQSTIRGFARNLKKDNQGYFIQIGKETKRIEVEDTAYFVEALSGSPAEGIQLFLNDETIEPLDPTTLSYRPGRLTCKIKGKTEEARFLRSSYSELMKFLQQDSEGYFLEFRSGNSKLRVYLAPIFKHPL